MGQQNMRTPPWLFALLDERFGPFQLDAFATAGTALCSEHYSLRRSAFENPWAPRTFSNPPFGIFTEALTRAYEQAVERGVVSVTIGPVGGSQSWHHNIARRGLILLPDRRVQFLNPDGSIPRTAKGTKNSADRDTQITILGPGYENRGPGFQVFPLEVPHG